MLTALIGHTGFVGSNLKVQGNWTELYNSKNIHEIEGRSFDQVVCAGVSATKWWANKNPEADWAQIQSLLDVLQTVQVKKFVLISTIDVYPLPIEVDESVDCDNIPNHAYGAHRLRVEKIVTRCFPDHHVLRLPGLFGQGLKKNVIYDLMNCNCLDAIQSESKFQYYYLKHLAKDIQRAIDCKIRLLNIATGPVSTREIHARFFPQLKIGSQASATGFYNFKSKYAPQWGRNDGYLYSKEQILDDLADFIKGHTP